MNDSSFSYAYRFGRFELQPGERRLLDTGVPAVVEPRAFDLLVALVERAGHLVTKEELFELVWPNVIVEENNLQVQISALRKILGAAAIATVSRRGYRFTLESARDVVREPAPVAITSDVVEPSAPLNSGARERFCADSNAMEAPYGRSGQNLKRHSVARPQGVLSLVSGAVVVLIAATSAWLLGAGPMTAQTSATSEPPTLSMAILPFVAPGNEQIAARLMPDITSAFGRNARSVRVASPSLVARYKGTQVDTGLIGREAHVRYVAEGEITRGLDGPLLTARLIDATNGAQIWSERFAVPAGDVNVDVDEFATKFCNHLWMALLRAEQDRAVRQPATSMTATDFWLRGRAIDDESLVGALAARKLYEKALDLDPRLVGAMLNLGYTYGAELDLDPAADVERLRQDLERLSLRAIATDSTDTRAWLLRGFALTNSARWKEVLDATAEANRIEPYHVGAFGQRARALTALGRFDEAAAEANRGLALDPSGSDVAFLLRQKCKALSYLGLYEDAAATCRKAAVLKEMLAPYVFLTAVLAQQGEADKAAFARSRLLELNPGYSIALFRRTSLALDGTATQLVESHVIAGLRKAGVPEK